MITDFSNFVPITPHAGADSRPASMSNRISRLFDRRRTRNSAVDHSQRTSGACEVPIFMSPSSDRLHIEDQGDFQSRHDGLQQIQTINNHSRPYTIPASSIYSESPGQQHQPRFMEEIEEEEMPIEAPTPRDLEEGNSTVSYATSETRIVREKRRRRRRISETTRQRIAAKKRLSMAFGVTAVASIITYLVLAVTGTAHGLMFHILSILFILALAGVFLHSFIRLLMLRNRRRARHAHHRDWHGSSGRSTSSSSSSSQSSVDPFVDPKSEKPVEIVDGPEEVVTTTPRGKNKKVITQPPPVYGNFRESKRMDPERVFWQKQTPSPTTPTYEEAMHDIQTAVGFQPPEYVSPKRERQPQGSGSSSNVHPLERERLVGLMANTM